MIVVCTIQTSKQGACLPALGARRTPRLGYSRVMSTQTNWSGNVAYKYKRYHEPTSIEELQQIVRHAEKVRVIGTRHSFSTVADPANGAIAELVSLSRLPFEFELDEDERQVRCSAHMTCGDLAKRLHAKGWALHNMASLPHISIAGAIGTATHGSGDANGNLFSAVVSAEFVDAHGALNVCVGEQPSLGETHDSTLNLLLFGCIGCVVTVTLTIQPTFDVRQDVYVNVPWSHIEEQARIEDIFGEAYSVSLFTDWISKDGVQQAWFKRKVTAGLQPAQGELYGGKLATRKLHPVPSESATTCTLQGEPPGPWQERLPHFLAEAEPSARGEELQSEYFVPREHAAAAARAVHAIGKVLRFALKISELRSVASDSLWLSPSFRRPSLCFHFTWGRDEILVNDVLPVLEGALAPFEPRPHWGKIYRYGPIVLARTFPRLPSFRALAVKMDPTGKFRNRFVSRVLGLQDEFDEPTSTSHKDRRKMEDAAPFPLYGWALKGMEPRPYDIDRICGHVIGSARDGDDVV